MLRLIVACALFTTLIANGCCFTVPQARVKAYDDQNYEIRLDDQESIVVNSIYYNLNKKLENIDQADHYDVEFVSPSQGDGEWVILLWSPKPIKAGDFLSYILTVGQNGVLHYSEPRSFQVKEILPASSRPVPYSR